MIRSIHRQKYSPIHRIFCELQFHYARMRSQKEFGRKIETSSMIELGKFEKEKIPVPRKPFRRRFESH